ncbi:unnamed protein product [Nesidiocoris tenuis]|uniref:Uncharacterized protein n=1 Tax=Nesidiocoris tenuis TaxID=355587 RepID=A0A6H5GAN4_9HEMI|nr:unnamed protein product [Nesidiocoris tenuis]
MDPAKPTTSKKHAEITKAKEEYRRRQEETDKSLNAKDGLIAHLEFQTKQLSCALNEFKAKEKSWNDTEEELDYSYDLPVASIPAEEDLLSVSPLPVDPILTPDLPSADQDGSKKQLRVDGSKECKATFAIEETLGLVTTVPELPAADVTPHCEVDAVVNRNETELVNSSGTNDEPIASSSSPGRAVSPKPSQSPTEENLPQRKTRFRKRKASESSSVSEALELSNLAEPLDKQMAADVGSIVSGSQSNGLERISEHTSNDDGFATPSSPIIAPRRSPRHIKSPAAQQVTPCVRKSPRKRAVKIKSPQQAEDQNSAQATSELPQRCLDVSDVQDGPSILGQSQSVPSRQSPEETPASDDIAEETPAIEDRTLVAALTPAENCAPGKAAPGRSQTNLESPTKKPESSLGKISPEVGDTPDSEQASKFDWSNSSKTSQSATLKSPIHIDTGDSRGRGADESFLCNLIFGQLCWSFQLLSIQKSDNGCLLKRSSKPDKSPLCGQSDIAGFSIIGNQRCLGKPSFSDGQAKSKFNTYREAALPTEIKEEHDVDSEVAPSMFPGHFFGDQHRFRACSDKFVPDSIQYSGVMSPCRTAPKSHPGFMQSSANSVSSHNYFPFSRSNFKGEGPANGCHSCGSCDSRSFHNGLLMTSNRAVNHRYVPPDANSPQSWSHCRNAQFPSPTTEIHFQNHCKSAKTSQIAAEVPTIDLTEPRSDLVAHKAGLQGTPLIPSTSPFLNRLPPQFGDNFPFKFPKDPAGFGKPKFLRTSERALISPSRLSGISEVPVVFVDKTQDTKGDVRCMSSPDMSVDSVNSLKVSSHLPAGLQRNEPISDSKSCTGSIGQNPASLNNLNPSTLSLDTHDTPTNPDSLLQQGQAKQAQLENLIKTSKASPSKKSPKNDTKDSKVSHASHRSPVKCSNNTNDAKASHAFHQSSPKRLNGTKDPNGSHATHQSPSKCSKVTKDPKASHASPQSTPTKLRRMSSGSPSKSIVRPAHSERLILNLPIETPTQSKAQVSKSDIGSLPHGTGSVGVPVNTGCEVLLEASVREVAPEKCSNPLPTLQKAVNCDQTASSSAKKRMLPPNALRSRGGLRNLVSGSKPFEDTDDKSSGSLFPPGAPSKHQNASAEQPEAQDDSPRAQKKSSVSKSTKKNARLKSAKKDQNSDVGQSEKPAMQVTKDAGCSCQQLYDHCPLKKKKSENCEKRAIDRPKFPKKTPPPEEPPETKRSRTRKRKLSETKSVPCKKKSLQFKSAEFVDDSSDSDSQITKRTSEGSLAENGAKRDEPASKAISGCNIEADQPKTLQRFNDIVEDADPLSDEAVLAADISESSPPEVNNSEVIVDECSEIVGISSTAPDPATHGSPGVISSNLSTVELEHNYPSQFAMSPPTRPPKDPLSNRPNELNHLANFFQRSSSYGPSLPVADRDGGDDFGNGSDSDGDSQMLIDEQSSRCPELLSPAESSIGEIGEKPLSYWPETAVVLTPVSEPIAVPNFYRANDGPESVEAPKSQPLAEDLENDMNKSADVSGAPNFYAPAADVIRETTPPVTSGVRQFLTMDSSAELVQQIPDEFIPCSLNIMAFASHYKLPEEQKPKAPFNVGKSSPLCYTIAYLIMKQGIFGNCPPNLISTYKVAPLRKKLAIHYGYKFSPDITRDHVIVDLVAKIKNKGLPIVDAVMESLVHFSRLDIDGVAKIISTWTPNDYRVTPSAVKNNSVEPNWSSNQYSMGLVLFFLLPVPLFSEIVQYKSWNIKNENCYNPLLLNVSLARRLFLTLVVFVTNSSIARALSPICLCYDVFSVVFNSKNNDKGFEYSYLHPWLKEGLLVSTGRKWFERRKTLTPSFHFKILGDNVSSIENNAKIFVKKMLAQGSSPFNVEAFINSCTLQVICHIGFSMSQSKFSKIKIFLSSHSDFHPFDAKNTPFCGPPKEGKKNLRYKKPQPFLDTLLTLDLSGKAKLTDADIQEEVDTFMFEGADTTTTALTMVLYELGMHQDIQEKVYKEQLNIFGTSDREVNRDDLSRMDYLEMCIKEALRLYPPVSYMSRRVNEDMTMPNGDVVPKDAFFAILPYIVHRNPKYFTDPERFIPERFTPEECVKRHPFAYIPFSAGPRNCIGQKFAMMEMKVVVSRILRNVKITSITKRSEIKLTPTVILRSMEPILVTAEPR